MKTQTMNTQMKTHRNEDTQKWRHTKMKTHKKNDAQT